MSYDCPHCGKKDIDVQTAMSSVYTYKGCALVASPCCQRPIRVTAVVSYSLTPFKSSEPTDNWGQPYAKHRTGQEIKSLVSEYMDQFPWKYATHCLANDPRTIFFFPNDRPGHPLQFDNNRKIWVESRHFLKDMVEIEVEVHDWLDPKYNQDIVVKRSLIKVYQELFDNEGFEGLDKEHTELGNTNSLGALPHLLAIDVVRHNNGRPRT